MMLSAGALALPAGASAAPTEACSPTPEVSTSFCVTADLGLSTLIAGRSFELDASAINTSPGVADTNKNDWLELVTLRLTPTDVAVPTFTPSADLQDNLLVSGEPSPSALCTETNSFAGCEAGHGTLRAEITGADFGINGFHNGVYGLQRLVNVVNPTDPEGTTRWAVSLRGCLDVGLPDPQCDSRVIDVLVPDPPAGEPLEIAIDARFQAPVPIAGGTVDVTLRSLEGLHIDQRSAKLANGTPADRGYILTRLPSECGTLDGSASFLAADARTVAISRPLEITGCTTTTLSVRTPGDRIKAKGTVTPVFAGGPVHLTLLKKKGQTFQEQSDKDVVTDIAGKYKATFNAPNAKKCRILAEFQGDLTHAPSSATKTFTCD